MVPTFAVDRSAGSATSFSPDSLATSTPQTFLVASRPTPLAGRRSRSPAPRARVRCLLGPHPPGWSRELDFRGFHHWFTARFASLPRLPSPDRLAVPIRLVVVGAALALTRISEVRLPPASSGTLRRAARWALSSHPIQQRLVAHHGLSVHARGLHRDELNVAVRQPSFENLKAGGRGGKPLLLANYAAPGAKLAKARDDAVAMHVQAANAIMDLLHCCLLSDGVDDRPAGERPW
jgi:hypothetical protein